MGGDYTKFTFNPRNDHSGVRKQQGRIDLDQDWNEQADIQDRRWRAETIDLIGRSAVPKGDTPPGQKSQGFQIKPYEPPGPSFTIGRGRIYVDGLLAENHGITKNHETGELEFDPVLAEERGNKPEVDYNDQPFLPDPVPLPTSGRHIVYLDVWQREVTCIEEPVLLEKALGGVDTTTRMQTVWQVKVLPLDITDDNNSSVVCSTSIDDWEELIKAPASRLQVSVDAVPAIEGPCVISPAGGYRGLENRLYRVEIHTGEDTTFKWSRDNGSVVTAVQDITTSNGHANTVSIITVETLGRDSILRFQVDDWVEILDNHLELHNKPGVMARILSINEAERQITLDRSINLQADFASTFDEHKKRHTRLRRWDQKENVNEDGLLSIAADHEWIDIEDGIKVSFSELENSEGRALSTGDYWVFAARTVDGSVEFLDEVLNADPSGKNISREAPPRGIHHHYCRLAVINVVQDSVSVIDDCRKFFPAVCQGCCTVTVGDGKISHGDYSNIQEAINAALSLDADTQVCILPGEYSLDSAIQIDNQNPEKSITIKGCGRQTRLIRPAEQGNDPVFKLTGNKIYLESLSLLPASGSNAILADNLYDSTVTKLRIISAQDELSTNGPNAAAIFLQDCYFVKLVDNYIQGFPGIEMKEACWEIQIEHNEFYVGGIWISDYCSEISIRNNDIEAAGGPGILLWHDPEKPSLSSNVQIQDNIIKAKNGCGITTVYYKVTLSSDNLSKLGSVVDLSIVGNRIESYFSEELPDCSFPDGTPAGGGIILTNVWGAIIRNNYIHSYSSMFQGCGILAENCYNLELIENTVVNNDELLNSNTDYDFFQAGVALLFIRDKVSLNKVFAARIHNNIISCSAGQALIVTAYGHISILDNNLTSYEYKEQPNLLNVESDNVNDKIYYGFISQMHDSSTSCMFIHNLDMDWALVNSSLIMVKGNVITMISLQIPQVTYIIGGTSTPANRHQINSVYILSDAGSILLSNNQFIMKLPANTLEIINQEDYTSIIINVKTETPLNNVETVTPLKNIQACGNFFKENFLNPDEIIVVIYSYFSTSDSDCIITSNIALNPYRVKSIHSECIFANNIPNINIGSP